MFDVNVGPRAHPDPALVPAFSLHTQRSTGRKPAAQLTEGELLQRHEANERRRLKVRGGQGAGA